jgi:hypothetical protein
MSCISSNKDNILIKKLRNVNHQGMDEKAQAVWYGISKMTYIEIVDCVN